MFEECTNEGVPVAAAAEVVGTEDEAVSVVTFVVSVQVVVLTVCIVGNAETDLKVALVDMPTLELAAAAVVIPSVVTTPDDRLALLVAAMTTVDDLFLCPWYELVMLR